MVILIYDATTETFLPILSFYSSLGCSRTATQYHSGTYCELVYAPYNIFGVLFNQQYLFLNTETIAFQAQDRDDGVKKYHVQPVLYFNFLIAPLPRLPTSKDYIISCARVRDLPLTVTMATYLNHNK